MYTALSMALNIEHIRRQFAFLNPSSGKTPVYFDSAATTQKPAAVLDAMRDFYEHSNGNAHRGLHALADAATEKYENARTTVQEFLSARYSDEIIFTRNATEAINLIAKSWGRANVKKGDAIVLSIMEHHSNIVPWLQLKDAVGCEIVWIDIDDEGQLKMDELDAALAKGNVKLVAITGQSNVLATRPNTDDMLKMIRDAGALLLVDGAQLAAHELTDVVSRDYDFFVFSGHKLYGPTGIGVLYARRELLKDMPAFLGGGMMIREVTKDGFVPADAPMKFEAGTMPVADAVGLAAAIDWFRSLNGSNRLQHEKALMTHTLNVLQTIDGLRILGPTDANKRFGCIAFTIDGIHPHDLTDILGQNGFALRAGNHCAQPLHERLGINASARLSFGLYNTTEEIDALIPEIEKAISILKR